MSGSMGDMSSLLRQAQQMQRELDRVREELKSAVVEGTAGGGAVRIELSGDRKAQSLHISDEAMAQGDKSVLEDLVLAALRDALARAEALADERRDRITGGMQLPGLF